MSSPSTLQVSWEKGMRRDVARHQLATNAAWNLQDVVLSTCLQERGGWAYASPDIHGVKNTALYIVSGMVAPFEAGDQNICFDEDGELYKITSPTVATDIGAAHAAISPSFHRERVIIPDLAGAVVPKVYNGSTIADLTGAPAGRFATVFNDWSALGSSAALPNRIWFSAAGDPASWDTSQAWIDADHKIRGLAALQGGLLAFTDHGVERWSGSIPPPGSDFTHRVLQVGSSTYTRSITQTGQNVCWASRDGIFMTEGSSVYDLTYDCGFKTLWQETVTGATWNVSTGILADRYLVVSVVNATTFVDCFVIDIPLRRFWRWTNVDAWGMWSSGPKLYFGRSGSAYVGELSPTFLKEAAMKTDADGTTVASSIETRFYQGPSGLKTWRAAYPTYDLRDAATDEPTVQCSYILSPEATSYTNVGSALAETTASTRPRIEVNKKSEGIALKFTRSAAASDFRLYGIDMDVYGMERSRTS